MATKAIISNYFLNLIQKFIQVKGLYYFEH